MYLHIFVGRNDKFNVTDVVTIHNSDPSPTIGCVESVVRAFPGHEYLRTEYLA